MEILLRVILTCAILPSLICQHGTADKKKERPVNPAQLLALIERADKVEVYTSYTYKRTAVLYSSTYRKDISALKDALSIEPPDGGIFLCTCLPSLELVLYRNGKELASVGVLPEGAIHTSLWDSDAKIQDADKWLRWFDDRRITAPREQHEREKAEAEQDRAAEERWIAAMPQGLRPIWPKVMDQMMAGGIPQDPDTKPLEEELAKEILDEPRRIRALMSWYGSGTGRWSGYPIYEDVAAEMLLRYQTAQLLAAVESVALNEQETEGAARLFGSWQFGNRRPDDHALIPKDLRRALLEHCLKSTDADKLGRARRAFE